MGINPAQLNDKQKQLIDSKDRKLLGRYAKTIGQIAKQKAIRLERHIHDEFSSFCRRNRIVVWHSNPVRKSSIAAGLPDYLCLKNDIPVTVEFKLAQNDLTNQQKQKFSEIEESGNRKVLLCVETTEGAAYHKATEHLTAIYNL